MRRKKRTLASQILVLVAALVAGLALALALIFGDAIRYHIQKRAAIELEALASSAAVVLLDDLSQRSRGITVISQSLDLWQEGLNSEGVNALLTRMRAANPNNIWTGVANADGIVVAETGSLLLDHNVSRLSWFAGGKRGPYVGEAQLVNLLEEVRPGLENGDRLHVLEFAAPIKINGTKVAVICTQLSWDWAHQVLERVVPEDAARRGVELLIFDRNGQLLYAPDGGTARLHSAGQRLPTANLTAAMVRWLDGEDYLTATARLEAKGSANLGWHIVARAREDRSLEPAIEPLLVAAGSGLIVALGVCTIAWFEARRLGDDLRKLAAAAALIEAGVEEATLPIPGNSAEVQTLSESLHSMAKRLLQAHADMEAQVKLRTAQLEVANNALEQLVRHDPLTGLLNRRGFEPKASLLFELASRARRPLSACMIDADHFKNFNDTHGHEIGDQVLVSLAKHLQSNTRRTDVLARWGGEEFVLLLPDTDDAAAKLVAEELRQTIAARVNPTWGRVTVSVGLAQILNTDGSFADLLNRADRALYVAKGRGRNQVSMFGVLS